MWLPIALVTSLVYSFIHYWQIQICQTHRWPISTWHGCDSIAVALHVGHSNRPPAGGCVLPGGIKSFLSHQNVVACCHFLAVNSSSVLPWLVTGTVRHLVDWLIWGTLRFRPRHVIPLLFLLSQSDLLKLVLHFLYHGVCIDMFLHLFLLTTYHVFMFPFLFWKRNMPTPSVVHHWYSSSCSDSHIGVGTRCGCVGMEICVGVGGGSCSGPCRGQLTL